MRALVPADTLLLELLATCVVLAVALGVALYFGYFARRQAREKEQLTAILEANARQQQALAELAQAALAATDFDTLCQQAAEVVARTLRVEYTQVLQLLPKGRELRLVAGVGWREELLRTATVSAGEQSQAGYTLERAAPVVVEDLRAETRFIGSALLREQGVVSGLSIIIPGPGGGWGVLSAHTRTRRDFGAREVDFFQVVAHMLGEMLVRRTAQEQLERFFQLSVDPLVIAGLDGYFKRLNPVWPTLLGHSEQELLSRPFLELVHPEDQEATRAVIAQLERGEVVRQFENRYRTADGSWKWILWSSVAVPETGTIYAVAHDLTERKQLELRVAADQRYTRTLIEASIDALATISPEGRVTDVNQEMERLTGRTRGELVGSAFRDCFSDSEAAQRGVELVLREGRVRDYELAVRRPGGGLTPVSCNATLYRNAAGEPVGVFAAARDITDQKRAHQTLAEHAAELARSNAELQQFAYAASHDLQEPLRMVASYTQLLARRYEGKLDEKADEFIRYAAEGATRMQALIRDLLSYSRVTTGARQAAPVQPQASLERALVNLRLLARDTGATITFDPMPAVMADEIQLMQVFQNLVGNAMKFHGGAAPEVHVAAEVVGSECRFSVRDNGLGIAPEHRERIFLLFQRLHSRGEYPGTGLGLAICRKVVERHGGRIWVESSPGEGSTFYFTLPLAAATTGEAHVGSFAGNAAD